MLSYGYTNQGGMKMNIFQFLNLLDEKRIGYRLERVRDSLMV